MITSYHCPNCGANVPPGPGTDFTRCPFCASEMVLQRPHGATSRMELELERDQILTRLRDWNARADAANARSFKDVILPAAGCCGIYVALFVVGSLLLTSAGVHQSSRSRSVVAAVVIFAAVAGGAAIAWRREIRRRDVLRDVESGRAAERSQGEERLREIEAGLERLK